MTDFEFVIDPVFTSFGVPVTLGTLETAVSVQAEDTALGAALDESAAKRATALSGSAAADVPEIAATRRAYKVLGKDPSRYRPSAEALLRRVLRGKGLFRVNNVVDVNNLVSISTGFCIGAYDTDQLRPPITLRSGGEGESYEAIGRGPINLQGLPLLSDESGAFGSPTSDSERTMIQPQTRRLLMVIYGFHETGAMNAAMDMAVEALTAHCHAGQIAARVLTNSPQTA